MRDGSVGRAVRLPGGPVRRPAPPLAVPAAQNLLHLIVKRITLDDRKRVGSVELAFNEETEKHFLSVAPSADNMAEGAFPLSGKAPLQNFTLFIVL